MKPRRGTLRFAFVSSNLDWGGSEILWSEAAMKLASEGHGVKIYKNRLPAERGIARRISDAGCEFIELARFPLLPAALFTTAFAYLHHLSIIYQCLALYVRLRTSRRPDLVIVSQGGNFDGWLHASMCRRLRLPFVLICQKAGELYWPSDRFIQHVRAVYESALHSYFVSRHNLELTELQIGRRLPRSSVVRNPFNADWTAPLPWPDTAGGFRLACVGRLHPKEKGQDILLRVLAMEKWRQRPVSLRIYGSGEQLETLKGSAEFLQLANVDFAGFATDISSLWAEHHALVLPSRAEGLPLVVVECMLSGRVPIVTNVAGNPEIVTDTVSGFLADAATVEAFDTALERAWRDRAQWAAIGKEAATRARELVPQDPAQVFATALVGLAKTKQPSAVGAWAPTA